MDKTSGPKEKSGLIRTTLLFKFVLVSTLLFIADNVQSQDKRSSAGVDPYYTEWKAILDRHATLDGSRSIVDYGAIKKDPAALTAYLGKVSAVTEAEFRKWPEEKRLAFLMNVYNAYTFKLILDYYPVKSIKDIGGLFKKPWGIEFVPLLRKNVSLDHIEHKVIRKEYSDPRIHAALVCAAKSCPPVKAYSELPQGAGRPSSTAVVR